MRRYRLSPAARADLAGIWRYTAAQWGEAQADRYVLSIHDACTKLAAGSRQGRNADDIRPGYRKFAVGSHLLLFRRGDTAVLDIIRVLHRSMDITRHA